MTAADGSYTVTGLAAGTDYQACFEDLGATATSGSSDALGYTPQCYNNQPISGTPDPLTVAVDTARTGINAALTAAGAVSGTVTDAAGTHHGLDQVLVSVSSPT